LNKENSAIKTNDTIISMDRVCLLDLRAEKVLSPEDGQAFDAFVFGGILGDHPPKDRTGSLRTHGFQTRHLGDIQLSTDTALLFTKLIVENGLKITEIPVIDEPEFIKVSKKSHQESIQMEGFRYVSDDLDPLTGKITKGPNPKPLGNSNIYSRLIFEELSSDNIFDVLRKE